MNVALKEKILKTLIKDFWTNNTWAICISPFELKCSKDTYAMLCTFKELFEGIGPWCLIPEFSDKGRLHFHGIMKTKFSDQEIKDMRPRINTVMGKEVRMNVEKLKHKRNYTNYIVKDLEYSYLLFPTQDCLFFTSKQSIPIHWFNPAVSPEEFQYWFPTKTSMIDYMDYLHTVKCKEAGLEVDPDGFIVSEPLPDNIAE